MTDIPSVIIATIRGDALLGVLRGDPAINPTVRAYHQHCAHLHWHTGTLVTLTRDDDPDIGLHMHASLSFRQARDEQPPDRLGNIYTATRMGAVLPLRAFNHELAAQWIPAIFDPHTAHVWRTGAVTGQGQNLQVQHYIVPMTAEWYPRRVDEAFERQFRAMGWKPWAEFANA